MSRYTIELRYLIEGNYDLGLKDYPIFDESYREQLNNKIIQHYYFREIGFETEALLKRHDDHTQKDIEFHTAIALSSKNVVVPRLIPVINSSIPLFVEITSGALHEETVETHREIADAIAGHDPLRAQDAMYLHLVYNRKRILLIEKNTDQI